MNTRLGQDPDCPANNPEHTLQRFVERARRLHSLPAVAIKVLELTNQPQVDLHALKECIETDPAITTKVLRVVNSSLFGLSREVSDLSQALALLGIKPLKLLVLGFSLSESVFTKFTGKSMLRCWRHTLTKAVAAREIAEKICHVPGDEPFIAALLQDIGKLVLLQELGEPYARLINRPFASQHELLKWEVETLGFDNTELTSRLLAHWGLPDSLLTAIELSNTVLDDSLPKTAARGVARMLQLANLLANLLVDARYDLLASVLSSGSDRSRLTQAQLSRLVADLQEKVAQLADVFSLELPPGLDYRDVLVQAHARMSDVSVELAAESVRPDVPRAEPRCENAEMLDEVQALSTAVSQFINRSDSGAHSKLEPAAAGSRPTMASGPHASPANEVLWRPSQSTPNAVKVEAEPGLLNHLAMLVYACRQSRWALSLALVEIDHFPELVIKHGPRQANRMARLVHDACRRLDVRQVGCLSLRHDSFGVTLPNCDRHQAAKICDALVQEVRHLAPLEIAESGVPLTVSVGLASVEILPKNFAPKELVDSATRCLSAARLSGGNTLKSIGIY